MQTLEQWHTHALRKASAAPQAWSGIFYLATPLPEKPPSPEQQPQSGETSQGRDRSDLSHATYRRAGNAFSGVVVGNRVKVRSKVRWASDGLES